MKGAILVLAISALAIPVVLGSCAPDRGQPVAAGSVVDDAGRLHSISTPRSRIVSLVPAATETLIALGAMDRLIARTRYDEQPGVISLPSVGGGIDPSIEFLAELAPELIILWPGGGSGGGGSLGDRLSEVGLDWYGAELQTLADFRRHTRNIGHLVGFANRADSLIASVEAELDAAAMSWSGRSPVDVLYVVQSDPPMTVGPGTFLDAVLGAAGGANVFWDIGGQWPLVSLEEVVWRDPAYVIVPLPGYGTPAVPPGTRDPSADRLAGMPGWSVVPAVAAGRVISVDASLFGRPGPHMGDAALYLSLRLHGGAAPGDSIPDR